MRIVAIIFGILAAIVDLILVIVSIAVPEVSLWGWIVVLTIVTVGLFFSANKVKKQKEARQAAQVARNTPFMEENAISAIAQGELPVVTGTPVLLEEGEVAHYYAPATKIVTKNKAVGRTGSGAGVRVRVAKGVSVSTGGGSSRTVYGEVTETYSGAIVLTNRRIVFIHNQAGFECKISALTAVTPVDGSVVVQARDRRHISFQSRDRTFSCRLFQWSPENKKRRSGNIPGRFPFAIMLFSGLPH